jgi:hypothetical protein
MSQKPWLDEMRRLAGLDEAPGLATPAPLSEADAIEQNRQRAVKVAKAVPPQDVINVARELQQNGREYLAQAKKLHLICTKQRTAGMAQMGIPISDTGAVLERLTSIIQLLESFPQDLERLYTAEKALLKLAQSPAYDPDNQ